MEPVILDHSPLADYLLEDGIDLYTAVAASAPHSPPLLPTHLEEPWATPPASDHHDDETPPLSPSFAPVGRPSLRKRFRNKIPDPLRLETPRGNRLSLLHHSYSKAVASTINRADNTKFLERFRYTIVASQLLNGHSFLGLSWARNEFGGSAVDSHEAVVPTAAGLAITVGSACALAFLLSWVFTGGYAHLTKKRVVFVAVVLALMATLSQAYIRQQWLRYVRNQVLAEASTFVIKSQDFDSASNAALTLVQEVELVSRGYRISAPLPPISRIEDRKQTRRCVRIRRVLKARFADLVPKYAHVFSVVGAFSDQQNLEKYYDIYDVSDLDVEDAQQGFSEKEFEDPESVRALKIAVTRFYTIRKMFLCALLAYEAPGDNNDFLRWATAVEGLKTLNEVTTESYGRLCSILSEEETFPVVMPSQTPLSPGKERWRSQLRKLSSLSTGIRGLQAKLTLLREESDRSMNEVEDVSEFGPNIMAQYESIGQDLKLLIQAWEDGKAALASGIDRNEKRLSSISSMISPVLSLDGLATADQGGSFEALWSLNGENSPGSTVPAPCPESKETEVFEAVALPRPRSLLTREERITKMKEERERKEVTREKADARRGMLRELETVISLRPKRAAMPPTLPVTPTATPE